MKFSKRAVNVFSFVLKQVSHTHCVDYVIQKWFGHILKKRKENSPGLWQRTRWQPSKHPYFLSFKLGIKKMGRLSSHSEWVHLRARWYTEVKLANRTGRKRSLLQTVVFLWDISGTLRGKICLRSSTANVLQVLYHIWELQPGSTLDVTQDL